MFSPPRPCYFKIRNFCSLEKNSHTLAIRAQRLFTVLNYLLFSNQKTAKTSTTPIGKYQLVWQ